MRSKAVLAFRGLLEAGEARERALATGTDALLQDLRARKIKSKSSTNANTNSEKSGHDPTFVKDVEVSKSYWLNHSLSYMIDVKLICIYT